MLNLLRQRRNTRDVAAARLQKLELEEFTPLQIGQELVSQAPVRARGELWRLIRKAHPPAPQLSWLADADIPDDVRSVILKDVPRSFPEYTFFETPQSRENLTRILFAYAASDPEVGYCQGLNFVAGCILLYSPDPEEAFATLHLLLLQHGMRALYLPAFANTQENMDLVYGRIPADLQEHLEACGVAPSLFLPSWLLTVFAADFPPSFCARIIDIMLSDGWQRMLINTAVALLTVAKQTLMQVNSMERVMLVVKNEMPALPLSQLHEIITVARQLPWTAPANARQLVRSGSSLQRRTRTPSGLGLPPRPARASRVIRRKSSLTAYDFEGQPSLRAGARVLRRSSMSTKSYVTANADLSTAPSLESNFSSAERNALGGNSARTTLDSLATAVSLPDAVPEAPADAGARARGEFVDQRRDALDSLAKLQAGARARDAQAGALDGLPEQLRKALKDASAMPGEAGSSDEASGSPTVAAFMPGASVIL